jgi:hypothetical protein
MATKGNRTPPPETAQGDQQRGHDTARFEQLESTVAGLVSEIRALSASISRSPSIARAASAEPETSLGAMDRALSLLSQHAELQIPTWDSHAMPMTETTFTATERVFLETELPQITLLKLETGFANTKRALQYMVFTLMKLAPKSTSEVRDFMTAEAKRDKFHFSPETALNLIDSLRILECATIDQQLRQRARFSLGLTVLRVHSSHHKEIPRLLLALVAVKPTDAKEVTSWLGSKSAIPATSEFGQLPIAPSGGF